MQQWVLVCPVYLDWSILICCHDDLKCEGWHFIYLKEKPKTLAAPYGAITATLILKI